MSSAESISQFKPATLSMAAQMRKRIKVNKEGVAEIPDDLYEETLKDTGLDMTTINKVQKHNAEVVAAMTMAVGENAIEALKKHPKLDQVTGEMKAGRDEISVVINRTRESVNPKDPGGAKIVQHGASTIKYTVKGTANSGELKKVRQHLMSQAADILNS